MTDAIIPALTHRIPSELRSQACLGESSTRMGDPLGSPRVASLFFFSLKIWFNFAGSIGESFCFSSWRKRERGQGAGARVRGMTSGGGDEA